MNDTLVSFGQALARNWLSFVPFGLLALAGLLAFGLKSLAQGRLAISDYRQADIAPAYRERRRHDLGRTPSDVGPADLGDEAVPYGVVLDFGGWGGLATLAAFASGEVSLYLSSGEAFTPAVDRQDRGAAARAAKALVHAAQKRLRWMHVTGRFPLPRVGRAKLYALTRDGVFSEDVRVEPVEPPLQEVWDGVTRLIECFAEEMIGEELRRPVRAQTDVRRPLE